MPARPVSQIGMDEQVITDKVVEQALEARQDAKDALAPYREAYQEAHEAATAALQRLELPIGAVARVGRFRIERRFVAGRSVSFETKQTARLAIGLIEEG